MFQIRKQRLIVIPSVVVHNVVITRSVTRIWSSITPLAIRERWNPFRAHGTNSTVTGGVNALSVRTNNGAGCVIAHGHVAATIPALQHSHGVHPYKTTKYIIPFKYLPNNNRIFMDPMIHWEKQIAIPVKIPLSNLLQRNIIYFWKIGHNMTLKPQIIIKILHYQRSWSIVFHRFLFWIFQQQWIAKRKVTKMRKSGVLLVMLNEYQINVYEYNKIEKTSRCIGFIWLEVFWRCSKLEAEISEACVIG